MAAILKVLRWLQDNDALETRISASGVETLARWELQRNGLDPSSQLLSLALTPAEGWSVAGTPRQHGGYVVVFRLREDGLATLIYSLGGVLEQFSTSDSGDVEG